MEPSRQDRERLQGVMTGRPAEKRWTLRPAPIVLCAFAASAPPVTASEVTLEPWFAVERADAFDRINGIAALPDGGVIMAGTRFSPDTVDDGWVLRLDDDGEVVLDATVGGEGAEEFRSLALLPDGGVAIAGNAGPADGVGRPGWLVLLDPEGGIVWQRTLPDTGRAHPAVAVFPDGEILVVGSNDGATPEDRQDWLMRLDAGGDIVWEKRLDDKTPGRFGDVAAMPDGGAIIVGALATDQGDTDGRMLRIDADGRLIWDGTFGGPQSDALLRVAVGPDGSIFAAGFQTRDNRVAGWLASLDQTGSLRWERVLDDQADMLTALTLLPGGSVIAAGGRQEGGARAEIVAFRFGPEGEPVSAHAFASPGDDWVPGLATGADGSVFLVANEGDRSWDTMRSLVLRFSPSDLEQWAK